MGGGYDVIVPSKDLSTNGPNNEGYPAHFTKC